MRARNGYMFADVKIARKYERLWILPSLREQTAISLLFTDRAMTSACNSFVRLRSMFLDTIYLFCYLQQSLHSCKSNHSHNARRFLSGNTNCQTLSPFLRVIKSQRNVICLGDPCQAFTAAFLDARTITRFRRLNATIYFCRCSGKVLYNFCV